MDTFKVGDRVRFNSGEYKGKTGVITDIAQLAGNTEISQPTPSLISVDTRCVVTLDESGDEVILYDFRFLDKLE